MNITIDRQCDRDERADITQRSLDGKGASLLKSTVVWQLKVSGGSFNLIKN
jgi:hypothetical protein